MGGFAFRAYPPIKLIGYFGRFTGCTCSAKSPGVHHSRKTNPLPSSNVLVAVKTTMENYIIIHMIGIEIYRQHAIVKAAGKPTSSNLWTDAPGILNGTKLPTSRDPSIFSK